MIQKYLRHKTGNALLSTMISGVIIAITSLVIGKVVSQMSQQNEMQKRKFRAGIYATELAEYFRSKTTEEIASGVMENFPLCAEINTNNPSLMDPTADLPGAALPGATQAKRGYTARIVNLETLTEREDLCGIEISEIPQLGLLPQERLMISISVTWNEPSQTQLRSIANTLTDEKNLPTVPPSVPPPGCNIGTTNEIFDQTQIQAAMGFDPNTFLISDGYHAQIVCDKLGFNDVADLSNLDPRGACSGKRLAVWQKDAASYQYTPLCGVTRYMSSVTCTGKRTGACNCAQEKTLWDSGPGNIIATNNPNIPFYGMGSGKCLRRDGVIDSGVDCPRIAGRPPQDAPEICRLLGYRTVKYARTRAFSSCGNNSVAVLNAGTWSVFPACSSNNHIGDQVTCADPDPVTCRSWY